MKVKIKPVKDSSFVDLFPSLPSCDKCPHCCRRYSCRGKTAKMLAGLGSKGFESKGCSDIEREIQPNSQNQTFSHYGTSNKECTCQSPQEQLPEGGIAFPPKSNHGKGQNPVLSRVSCSQIQPKVMAHLGTQYLKLVFKDQSINQLSTCLISVSTDFKAHHPIHKA